MGIRSRRRIRNPAIEPPSRRRRLDSGRKDDVHHHDLPWSAERRDWAALPRDVLFVILSLVPQADILRGAGLACASWRRLALHEPLLWRRIDLAAYEDNDDDDEDEDPPVGWQRMEYAASTAISCSSSPAARRRCGASTSRAGLHTPSGKFMTVLAKKLPLLEKLVLSDGLIDQASLATLVDHCPRLQLLDADGCSTWCPIGRRLRAKLESRIKDLRLPRLAFSCGGGLRPWPVHPPLTDVWVGTQNLSGRDDHTAPFP